MLGLQLQKTRTVLIDNISGLEEIVISMPEDDVTVQGLQVFVNKGIAETIGVEDTLIFGLPTSRIPIATGNSMNFSDVQLQASRKIIIPKGCSVSIIAY